MEPGGVAAIILFSLILVFILLVVAFTLKRDKKFGFKRIWDSRYREVENTEMLNELLKRKLEKKEDLSTEELQLIRDLQKNNNS